MQTSHVRVSAWEREGEVLRTLVQKDLFPTIVNGLLRVLVLLALKDGCKRGDVLHTSPKPVRQRFTETRKESEQRLLQRRARESQTCGCPS